MVLVRHLVRTVVTLVMVSIAAVLLVAVWRTYMTAPWTRDGRVQAEVVDIAPEVPGTIASVPVHDNQFVHKGDVLFELDPVRFRLAIAEAQAAVERATQQLRLDESNARRRQGLNGVVSAEEQQQYAITAAVASAGLDAARVALTLANLNMVRSALRSPVNGYVTNLRLRVGDYATVGQPRVAVIDADSFWIYGYFEETQIDGVHVGDPARIKLMGYRQTLIGYVESITRGINDQDSKIDRYGLPDVNPVFTWVRLAQRIPVRVAIGTVPPGILLASGMTCSISVADAANPPNTPFGRLLGVLQDYL
ncbi:MAG: efflux transporter periplasmic adaptor subunit [Rhodopila sp.]|jgi:RND family efflux transporter MFP subunit|nr:efflux transporter periplasmic adaptor subunit [Rhodopila sp.]